MIRGTTPRHIFILPNNTNEYSNMLITYRQNNCIKLEKQLSDLTVEEDRVWVRLTQEETFAFEEDKLFIELKVLTNDGRALSSATYSVPVISSLTNKVLTAVEVENNEG